MLIKYYQPDPLELLGYREQLCIGTHNISPLDVHKSFMTFLIITFKRIKLKSRAKSQIEGNSFAIPNLMYRQAGWIGTGGVNRVTYYLVLAEAFVLSYDILLFPKNMFCQVNDYI